MRQSGYWLVFVALWGCQAKTSPQTAATPAEEPPVIAAALALLNQGEHEQGGAEGPLQRYGRSACAGVRLWLCV